ncbi:MAG: AEC family transporter [Xylanivirga thermophila]|jgi:malate permease and related proteins|uniref:AEC family transporter n=1 Tax=Xylanivirga thermophila TaxID=2496273 RepID=UPI00101D9A1B|nr:AEC family transporter [Xylanivirga thermophila]
MNIFIKILTNNILPILIIVFLGYFLNKRFDFDINTLSKINFYLYVPSFTFYNLYKTQISMELINVLIFGFSMFAVNFIIGLIVTKAARLDKGMTAAMQNALMFYNSGNIGIPLITLVFSDTPYLDIAIACQVMILVVQNLTTNTIGFINAGRATTYLKDAVIRVFKMPTIYIIPLVFIFKALPIDLTNTFVWPTLTYIQNGLISIALFSLGVQLSKSKLSVKDPMVYLAVAFRLLGGPAIAALLIYVFKFEGAIAQALFISSSVPTALNTALIAVECKNQEDFAAQVVMLSTILSAVTMIGVIYMSRILFPV